MTLGSVGEFRALVKPAGFEGLAGLTGLGQTSTSTAASASSYTFSQGAGLWFSQPTTAIGLVGSAFSNISLPVAQGILVVPAGAALLLWFLMSRK